jgi:hypothetical protein
MSATSGPTSRPPFAYYDHESSCWRTSQGTFPWDSTPSSVTLPRWGSMRSGELFERRMPVLPTVGPGSSSLLPTPLASDGEKGGPNQRGGSGDLRLASAVQLLPTPTASEATGAGYTDRENGGGRNLRTEVTLLPTPVANDSGNPPDVHLRKKPGWQVVTSLQIITDYGLLPTGGRIEPPSPAGSTSPANPLPGQLSLDSAAGNG